MRHRLAELATLHGAVRASEGKKGSSYRWCGSFRESLCLCHRGANVRGLLFFQLRRKPAKASGVFRSLSHIVIMLRMGLRGVLSKRESHDSRIIRDVVNRTDPG